MESNVPRTNTIYFTRKMKSIQLSYSVSDTLVASNGCMKDLGVVLNSKLYFYAHPNYIY
jgi:hypothetical protein